MSNYLGLVLDRGKLAHRVRHGFGYGWLSLRVQLFISLCWNRVACKLYGHDDLLFHLYESGIHDDGPPHCSSCCAPLTACVGH